MVMDLRALNYSWSKISKILGISRSTLYRKLEEAGISSDDHTLISNHELDEVIRSIKVDHPNDGEVLLQGHLVSMGIKVTRDALRRSIHRVDHAGAMARRRLTVRHRVYSVPHPNYMWHMDGHHKLIRWRFVIHGAIDGFSRTIIYLRCTDNNRAQTVVELFQEGVAQYGLPDHVRSDHGGENVAVWRFMISNHNLDYSCVISGSSVHNERIERLWRDVHRCIVCRWADTFRDMESNGLLDPLNEVDLYCLHYVYKPRINKCVAEFKESWNNHSLSSEGSMSPYQLFFEGANVAEHSVSQVTRPSEDIEIGGSDERVTVPRLGFVPCLMLLQQIHTINPLQPSCDNGIATFRTIIQVVGQHLLTHCSQCTL